MILIQVAGFLGSDAEERFTATGKRVISLRLATKVRKGGKEETVWWHVNIWGDRFDKMLPYLKKGTPLFVMGEMMKPETYADKEGKTQVSLSLTAEVIKFSPFGKTEKTPSTQGEFQPLESSQDSSVVHGTAHEEDLEKEKLPF